MSCKFCNEDKPLVKAHIIPEGFFRRLRDGQDPPRVLNEKDYPKKAPIGVYDKNILCLECERIFGDWDNHAQLILNNDCPGRPVLHKGEVVAYENTNYDYSKLKLFFMSLLWRASVSTHPFYGKICAGPFEEILKKRIRDSDPGIPDEFSVALARFKEHTFDLATLDPHPEKFEGINYCRFYMAGYVIYIKVDSRSTPPPHDKFILNEAGPLVVICRDLAKSKELPIVHKLGRAANEKLNKPLP